MRPHRFAFVLEQTLGHAAHARNIQRALDFEPEIAATVIQLEYRGAGGLGSWPGLKSWSFQASWAARRALMETLRAGRLDAMFIHTQVASLLAADLMRIIPTVVSLDATPENFDAQGAAYGHRRQARLLERAKRRVNQRAFGAARVLVTWCEWAAKSLERDYGVPASKIRVVHPGVDLERFVPSARGSGFPVRLLFVGGNFRRKGGEDLIEAMRGCDPDDVELDIVTGDLVDVDLNPSCRVHYGLQPQSTELIQLFRRADVFVLPTRGDCFPQAIAEAMACGLPIVASDMGGISEMVRHGINGWLVSPGDPRELGIAIDSLVDDADLRLRFGRASLDIARSEHNATRNNRAIFDLMAAMIGRPYKSVVA